MPEELEMLKQLGYSELNYVTLQRHRFQEVRDLLFKAVAEMEMPWKPLPCHSGYFMMVDVQACRPLVPESYFTSHDYDPDVTSHRLSMPGSITAEKPQGIVPLDLAFARWMGKENGVTMMPNSFFYAAGSQNLNENYVRLGICKNLAAAKQAVEKLRLIKL